MTIYDGLTSVVTNYFGPAGVFLVNAVLDKEGIAKNAITKEDLPKIADAAYKRGKEYNILGEEKLEKMKKEILALAKTAD
jgi:hypothetical protein